MAVKTDKADIETLAMAVAQARYLLNRECPFLGSLVNRVPIKIVSGNQVKTACVVNRGELGEMWLNPSFFAGMKLGEIGFVLAHEVLHLAYGFFPRFDLLGSGALIRIANEAHDFLINGQLDEFVKTFPEAGLAIPRGDKAPLLNRKLSDGKTLEMLYRELVQDEANKPKSSKGGAGSGKGSGLAEPDEDGSGENENDPKDEQAPRPDGEGFTDSSDCVMEDPAGGQTPEEQAKQDEMGRRWQGALAEAAAIHEIWRQSGQGRGALPGSVAETIDHIIRPQIGWVESLFHMAEGHLRGGGVSYSRLSKRGLALDTLLPGRARKMPRLAIVKDTSGSVDTGLLRLFGGVCMEIACSHEAETRLLQVDSALQMDEEVDDLLAHFQDGFEAKGRGGTVFEPAVEALTNQGEPVDLIVVLTDGGVSWPAYESWPAPVFVVSTGALPPAPYHGAKLELPRGAAA